MSRPAGEGELQNNTWFRALIIILVLVSALFLAGQIWSLMNQFSGILLVLFFAWLLAFILRPLASFLVARGVSRAGAVALVYTTLLVGIFLALAVIVPLIVAQLAQIGTNLPQFAEQVPGWIAPIQAELINRNINVDLYSIYRTEDLVAQLRDIGTLAVSNGIALATGVAAAFVNVIVVLVLSFYITADSDRIMGTLLDVVPDRGQDEVRFLLESVDRKFGGFLRGQLIQALIYAVGTAIVMTVFGLNYWVVASLVAGIVMFIPFFGPILGLIPPVLIALFTVDATRFILVVVTLLILQQIVLNVIAPKVMAEAVGMHPILVFLAILLGIQIAGPLGAIFGVPVLAVINAMAQLFYNRSEAVQRRRALRLGLQMIGGSLGTQTLPGSAVSSSRRSGRDGGPLPSQSARIASLIERLWNR